MWRVDVFAGQTKKRVVRQSRRQFNRGSLIPLHFSSISTIEDDQSSMLYVQKRTNIRVYRADDSIGSKIDQTVQHWRQRRSCVNVNLCRTTLTLSKVLPDCRREHDRAQTGNASRPQHQQFADHCEWLNGGEH